jgi:hypothetical protein
MVACAGTWHEWVLIDPNTSRSLAAVSTPLNISIMPRIIPFHPFVHPFHRLPIEFTAGSYSKGEQDVVAF